MALRHTAWNNKSCYNYHFFDQKMLSDLHQIKFFGLVHTCIYIYIYIYTCKTPIKVYGQVHYLAKLEKFSSYSLSSSTVINM